jgi:hypothetical protein
VLKNDFTQRGLVFNKIINLFGNIKNDDNHGKQGYGVEESPQELFNNIDVDYFQPHAKECLFPIICLIKRSKLNFLFSKDRDF